MNIEILYEDDNIVAVNKPAGVMSHPDGRTKEQTLAEWVAEKYPDSKHVGEPGRTQKGAELLRSGIVHRLDKETSGVMLLAKTQAGFDHLKAQFQNHEIKKEYHCFVYGEMKENKGLIERPIGRSASDFRLWSAQRGARGELREAVTEYDGVQRFAVDGEKYSFVRAFPKTGRTHQIRVHFKAIHHPLVADAQYAPKHANLLGFERLALHSSKITFTSLQGEVVSVSAPYPGDFTHALSLIGS